ncbi:MAG: DUF4040 domain-containing protein [Clostridiales bacterium]|nr:DUF4040 domain-containing protein [Clostridiales bacterium]
MIPIEAVLLAFLVAAAIATSLMKRILDSTILFAAYSIVMSLLWILLAAPDLTITEAAVGAGISGILFFVVLRQIRVIEREHHADSLSEWEGDEDAK